MQRKWLFPRQVIAKCRALSLAVTKCVEAKTIQKSHNLSIRVESMLDNKCDADEAKCCFRSKNPWLSGK